MNKFETVLLKIGHGIEYIPEEVAKGIAELPKIITLTEDAKAVAADSLPEVLAVIQDGENLVTAVAKDSGVFLADLAGFGAAVALAAANKGINIGSDAAVVAAGEKLIGDFQKENVADVIAALHQTIVDVQKLKSTVVADIKKLEADAGPPAAATATAGA
jgi:hypothetical protein